MKITLYSPLTRRQILKTLVAAPVVAMIACSDDKTDQKTTSDDMSANDMGTQDIAGDLDMAQDITPAKNWATGGTASMTGKSSYPDPFKDVALTGCVLTCAATIGPCHTDSPLRQDISDDWNGLPVRLALKVVNESCEPINDAIVEIWHTNHNGIYSGDINQMCNDTAEQRAAQFFRGYQRTNAEGRVDFDTCYPGWYNGRAVHIHFRVMTGQYDGADNAAAEIISQLFFEESLNNEIFSEQPLYKEHGQPDTSLTTDNIIGGESDPSGYICNVQRMPDGAMLASATIILRSTSAQGCTLQGSGPGGPGM